MKIEYIILAIEHGNREREHSASFTRGRLKRFI